MDTHLSRISPELPLNIDAICRLIADTQKETGEIPWHAGGKTDPWDHVEAAIGLAIGGYFSEARHAFRWMKEAQQEDGSWFASYLEGDAEDKTRDANISTYIAVGVFYYYTITGEVHFLEEMWPTVDKAIDFALRLQAPGGEIHWAISPEGRVDPMALLTGSCSVYMSIKCALATGGILGHDRPAWVQGMQRLSHAIRFKPHLFNIAKSRFSMDWFYPVLTGAFTGTKARQRIDRYWKKFVINGQGVKCVSDEPWVTLAETAELVIALTAMGNLKLAETIFSWALERRYDDGTFWCGYTCPDIIIWPEEKITWTNAVLLMAADALYGLTPASRIFNHGSWDTALKPRQA